MKSKHRGYTLFYALFKRFFVRCLLCVSACFFCFFVFDRIAIRYGYNSVVIFFVFFLIGVGYIVRSFFNLLKRAGSYFDEIYDAIEKVFHKKGQYIELSAELVDIENKINRLKQENERNEKLVYEAEQRKKDLMMYLAHDLKTPLSSIIGYLTLLVEEREISEQLQTKYLGIALHKAERLEELINEFFDITRFNFAKASLQMQQVNLTMLLEQVIFEFHPILLEKQLTCQLHAPSQVMVHCDGNKMQRVFDNLLRNACLYSFSKECIHIEVHVNQQYVNICFMNRAQTIPQEKLAHLFEQFYRLDMARHTSGGTGLGLAIAKQIVEWHHGKIEAKSADEQIEFYVSLSLIHQ